MEITYELKLRDFHDSIIAHRNRSALSKWLFRIPTFLALIVWVACLLFVAVLGVPLSTYLNLMIVIAIWAAVLRILPWWSARNQFTKQPAAKGRRTVRLDEAGISWRWNGGSCDNEWENIIRILDAKNHFIFYSSPSCFNVVPKRALVIEQLTDLRSLLNRCASSFKIIN